MIPFRLLRLAPLLNFFATRTHVSVFLCEGHRREQTRTRWAGLLAVVAGLASVGVGLAQRPPSAILAPVALVLLITGIFAVYLARGPRLRGRRILGQYIVIDGAGQGFRDTLPALTSVGDIHELLGITRSAGETGDRTGVSRPRS